jgi:hypothetical protein
VLLQAYYREYVRLYGADVDIETFRRLDTARAASGNIKIPKAVDAADARPGGAKAHTSGIGYINCRLRGTHDCN